MNALQYQANPDASAPSEAGLFHLSHLKGLHKFPAGAVCRL